MSARRRGPLDFIFYPVHHAHPDPGSTHTMDNTSCTIVAGSPNVVKAAFTKEVDFFERDGIEFLDPSLNFTEPNLLKKTDVRHLGRRGWGSPKTRATSR